MGLHLSGRHESGYFGQLCPIGFHCAEILIIATPIWMLGKAFESVPLTWASKHDHREATHEIKVLGMISLLMNRGPVLEVNIRHHRQMIGVSGRLRIGPGIDDVSVGRRVNSI